MNRFDAGKVNRQVGAVVYKPLISYANHTQQSGTIAGNKALQKSSNMLET